MHTPIRTVHTARSTCSVLVVLLLALFPAFAAAQPDGGLDLFSSGPQDPIASLAAKTPSVTGQLLADVTALQPGRPFRLGVRFTMQPGWHIYWRTAGDVGLPTKIKWTLPPGFTIGELQWPTPLRFEDAGLISYGYQNEVLLFAEVTPPGNFPANPQSFIIKADANWIACEKACIPGDAKLELSLPAGQAAPSPASQAFDEAATQVPRILQTPKTEHIAISFNPAPAQTPGREQRLEVTVRANAPWRFDTAATAAEAATALFPVASGNWSTSHPKTLETKPDAARFAWPVTWLADPQTTGSQLAAVLRLPLIKEGSAERRIARLEFPVSATSLSPSSSNKIFSFYQGSGKRMSLAMIFLYAFLGGIILNVMPCVLPVLSLKVLGFVRQAGESRGRTLRLGLAYTVGVLLSFAALAAVVIALQAAGRQVGQGFQLQDPRFVAVMAGVIFAVSLSLLGVYSIELPGSAINTMDRTTRREGLGGALLSGVLATALATPCTAPFLGPALAFAFTQPPALILAIFLAWGLGLAAPYLLLSINPAWLRFVPRPGRWMVIFEQVMGFVMLGFAVWLLGVLGAQAGAGAVVNSLAFLLVVAVACWVIGTVERFGPGRLKWLAALGLAAAVIVAGFWAFPERYLRSIAGAPAVGADRVTRSHSLIAWEPFSVARVEQLVKEGRTVFVDFTADWCTTCKVNEWRTLETERVRRLFKQYQVTALKADWTTRDETIGRVLAQFGSAGVPLYVIFPAGRPGQPEVLPTLITPEIIERALARTENPRKKK